MIDALAGRCTQHGWLSRIECEKGFCLKCEEPDDIEAFDEEFEDEIDEDFGRCSMPTCSTTDEQLAAAVSDRPVAGQVWAAPDHPHVPDRTVIKVVHGGGWSGYVIYRRGSEGGDRSTSLMSWLGWVAKRGARVSA